MKITTAIEISLVASSFFGVPFNVEADPERVNLADQSLRAWSALVAVLLSTIYDCRYRAPLSGA